MQTGDGSVSPSVRPEELPTPMLEVPPEVEFSANDLKALAETVSINVRDGSEGNSRE